MSLPTERAWVSVEDAAAYLQCTKDQVYKMARDGRLKSFQMKPGTNSKKHILISSINALTNGEQKESQQ